VRTETQGQSAGRARGLLSWAPGTGLKRNQGDGGALSLCGVISERESTSRGSRRQWDREKQAPR